MQLKRFVGECFVNGESLSVYMVRNGYALDWPRYSKGKFLNDQEFAKNNKLIANNNSIYQIIRYIYETIKKLG